MLKYWPLALFLISPSCSHKAVSSPEAPRAAARSKASLNSLLQSLQLRKSAHDFEQCLQEMDKLQQTGKIDAVVLDRAKQAVRMAQVADEMDFYWGSDFGKATPWDHMLINPMPENLGELASRRKCHLAYLDVVIKHSCQRIMQSLRRDAVGQNSGKSRQCK